MNSLLEKAFLQVNLGILAIDKDYNIILWNNFIADHTPKANEEVINHNLFEVYPTLPQKWLENRIKNVFLLKNSSFISWEQRPNLFEFTSSNPITGTSQNMLQNCTLFPITDEDRNVTHVCITVKDATVTALAQTDLSKTTKRLAKEKQAQQALIEKLEEAKNQLLQSEKMASIGQLAAGVAHEINNPVGFIKSNFGSLQSYSQDFKQAIEKYQALFKQMDNQDLIKQAQAINDEYEIDFIIEDIDSLISESSEGINRVEEIVKSLKHFSRVDSNEWEEASVNEGIESTLKVVAHELKYVATIEKDYGELSNIQCLPMQVNQVIMNLLINASQAIKEDGKIGIVTKQEGDYVFVKITDNGQGIEEKNLIKIFDPFFTTKPIGEGTGLGLSLSFNIIQKHKGEMTVDSEVGKGTTFTIKLPIHQQS